MNKESRSEHSYRHAHDQESLTWRDKLRKYGAIPATAVVIFLGAGELGDEPIKGEGIQTVEDDSLWDALEKTKGIEDIDRRHAVHYVQEAIGEEGAQQADEMGLHVVPKEFKNIDTPIPFEKDKEWQFNYEE